MKQLFSKALISKAFAVFAMFGLATIANAASDPKPHLEAVTEKISGEILSNKDKIKADSTYAKSLIKEHLLPEVDTEYMAKRILGKTHWTEASEAQRTTFTNLFVDLLLNTYAKGLAEYDGQPIEYEETQYSTSGNTANVRSKFIPSEGEPILIDYRLKVQPNEKWLVTDVIIEGVSMAKSFANQYREKIAAIGLEATLEELKSENAKALEATTITDQ
ncbi:MAG: ABC transporter substrate-binding protein [Kangiellaceae bacterium]|nr:ABC transporter substrate-binding protein [Kangiellaceae bacterium]